MKRLVRLRTQFRAGRGEKIDFLAHFQCANDDLIVPEVAPLATFLMRFQRKKTTFRTNFHVKINKGEGGLSPESFAKCEDIRSVSKQRLIKKLGNLDKPTVETVEEKLRFLIGL